MGDKNPSVLLSDLVSKVRNVDGKHMGKDGNLILPRRNLNEGKTHVVDPTNKQVGNSNVNITMRKSMKKNTKNVTTLEVNLAVDGDHGPSNQPEMMQQASNSTLEVNLPADGDHGKYDQPAMKQQVNVSIRSEQFEVPINTPDVVTMNEASNSPTKCGNSVHGRAGIDTTTHVSFASMFKDNTSKKAVRLFELRNDERVDGAHVTIPLEAVNEVSTRFANTLYGYFIGKRLAFPIVENHVKNTWAKYGLDRVMLRNGFFFFQFATKEGMEQVLENGPWLIRLVPIILGIWTPNTRLRKDEITTAPVWVKLHNVPIVAFLKVGLSLITTQIGRPIMLDTYTSTMCLKSWGRNTYARELVEVSSKTDLLDLVVMAITFQDRSGHFMETIDIEYEWRPPRCDTCKIFDHTDEQCPKKPKTTTPIQVKDDGFVEVARKHGKGKLVSNPRHIDGIRLTKPIPNYFYRPISKSTNAQGETSSYQHKAQDHANTQPATKTKPDPKSNDVDQINDSRGTINESDSEEIKNVFEERPTITVGVSSSGVQEGASTPYDEVPHVYKGSRIILGWNLNDVDITIIDQDAQVMHTCIFFKADKKELFCSFIYAHNRYMHRRALWHNLSLHKHYVRGRPWCLMGDFNAALYLDDKSVGSSRIDIAMREFKECVEEIEVSDVNLSGLHFTWNQKPRGDDGVLKKIDRIMSNLEFNDAFVGAHAIFQLYRISEHSSAVLNIPRLSKAKPRPFKFSNILVHNTRFKDLVQDGWNTPVSGFYMFKVVKKLKSMKKSFCKLLYDHGNLHDKVKRLRYEVDQIQRDLDLDPSNVHLCEEEAAYVQAFNEALLMEERFLKKKAKIEWLRVGDSNTTYFHKMVKGRKSQNRIDVVSNDDGVRFDGDQVPLAFVNHYASFLGQQGDSIPLITNDLFINILNPEVAFDMVRNVSPQEVKDDIFSMGDDKSPGPDGYTAALFKEAWPIISDDVTKAVQEFFVNGTLLKDLNHTIIALVPKVGSPTRINDYRRISKQNTSFTHELMHNYHLDRGPPRCAFKVDIQKAYDTVDWVFLKDVLVVSVNGVLHGFFKCKPGLRQGDPMSPYLFTLVMEVLTLMLHRRVRESDSFTYHHKCSDLNIINLCFVDDLFLFAHGNVHSATVIMEALDEFRQASGLIPSLPKGTAYFCNVLNYVKLAILHELIEKVKNRISDWKNKSLSAAGRLQLVQSVLASMHVYWASVFILPTQIMLDIEKLMRGFLWNQGNTCRGKSKVAWEVVCLPRKEGGLVSVVSMLLTRPLLLVIYGVLSLLRSRCGSNGFMLISLGVVIFGIIRFEVICLGDGGRSFSPLSDIVSSRDIHRAGFDLSSKVMDVLVDGSWTCPVDWYLKYPMLASIPNPTLIPNSIDRLIWKSLDGMDKEFSVASVWDNIRPRGTSVDWHEVVWFTCCIPRHAFNLWLVIKRKLKTQDSLRQWDVWDHMKIYAGLPSVVSSLDSIVTHLIPISRKRSARSVIAKLVLAASCYFIWQERNCRLFKNQKRSQDQIIEVIKSTVRLKLLTCKFKSTTNDKAVLHLWKLPDSLLQSPH
ncbi:hypothetical protein Tco_0939764 [Tanacetum coccineum]|uniref:Reverse transcriptase domain-containing protein n=1 Tax=Tanacetum coccineum TaxID=301880 RepID=A0ABQ5DS52_9ASTR